MITVNKYINKIKKLQDEGKIDHYSVHKGVFNQHIQIVEVVKIDGKVVKVAFDYAGCLLPKRYTSLLDAARQ